jgi:mono/diheme cytochrome c family protein
MKAGLIAVLAVFGVLAVVVFAAYREAIRRGFSAREKPLAIEEFVARRLRNLATGTEAREMMNPFAPNPEILAAARDHFADHCAICHGENGGGETETGKGLYPPVPDLRAAATQALTDGELFQIIQNGIRFTGMPGWGGEEGEDEEHWKVVLFIRHLPDLTPEELEPIPEQEHHHHGKAESSH